MHVIRMNIITLATIGGLNNNLYYNNNTAMHLSFRTSILSTPSVVHKVKKFQYSKYWCARNGPTTISAFRRPPLFNTDDTFAVDLYVSMIFSIVSPIWRPCVGRFMWFLDGRFRWLFSFSQSCCSASSGFRRLVGSQLRTETSAT